MVNGHRSLITYSESVLETVKMDFAFPLEVCATSLLTSFNNYFIIASTQRVYYTQSKVKTDKFFLVPTKAV